MWRRSLSQLQTLKRQPPAAHSQRWLSSAALTPEEQEMLNEPREAMDYDVLLVRTCWVMVKRETTITHLRFVCIFVSVT